MKNSSNALLKYSSKLTKTAMVLWMKMSLEIWLSKWELFRQWMK